MRETTQQVQRCYAKYVYLDVVQFSKRSAEAQCEIVQRLNEIIRKALDTVAVQDRDDRLLLPAGDGVCIALVGPLLQYDVHLRLALAILEILDAYNQTATNESRQFQVRIGVNQNTDILVTDINGGQNIAGAGINLASRIMDKADGGQVLVSHSVFHELQPSEIYMDQFKLFHAIGKHNISFSVHQYIDDQHVGLNKEVPSAFASRSIEKKLGEAAAFYFAQAILHREELLRIKASRSVYWGDAAVVLLGLLARDAYRLSKATEFDDAPTMHTEGSGTKTFEQQFEYYCSQDSWVRSDAADHIILGDEMKLSQFSECFEYGDYTRHYEFVSAEGRKRLKENWPSLWTAYELDKYV